jgi:hypothetical protein
MPSSAAPGSVSTEMIHPVLVMFWKVVHGLTEYSPMGIDPYWPRLEMISAYLLLLPPLCCLANTSILQCRHIVFYTNPASLTG